MKEVKEISSHIADDGYVILVVHEQRGRITEHGEIAILPQDMPKLAGAVDAWLRDETQGEVALSDATLLVWTPGPDWAPVLALTITRETAGPYARKTIDVPVAEAPRLADVIKAAC